MKLLKTLAALLLFFCASAQELKITLTPKQTFNVAATSFIGFDNFDAIYTLENSVLHKKTNSKNFTYQNLTLGTPSFIDIINPLRLLVYYQNMNCIVLLDNQLNETNKINFTETNPNLIPLYVRVAAQNKLWLFDGASQKLGVYDINAKTFQPLSTTWNNFPKYTSNDYNYFYWIDVNWQFFSMNLFGNITKLGEVPEAVSYQIINKNEILLKQNTSYYWFNTTTRVSTIIPILEKSPKKVLYFDQILAIFTEHEIRFYNINLP